MSETKIRNNQILGGLDGWIPISDIYPFSFTMGSTRGYALVVDNGVALDGNWSITSGSATLNFFDAPLSAFTNSGNKSANAVIIYEI